MTTSQQSNAGNKDAPDPIAEAKMLMPVLKQSLVVLMRSACQTLLHSRFLRNPNQKGEIPEIPRIDQHLEEFYAIIDQIQQCLLTASDSLALASDSSEINSLRVDIGTGNDPKTQSYGEYLTEAQSQAEYIEKLHEVLEEFVQSVTGYCT
ncbi:mediator of RNA polymerase II transcription subunit 29-like [Oscarella lobularis]|uniref:mediator of RNA polymerase II transcription subunit 29-like n=1 Tax=Oscarella lobularis TaxID=121494 RepID=UPI0033137BFE